MFDKLSERDKRALVLGGIIVAAIVLYAVLGPWLEDWRVTRAALAERKATVSEIIAKTDELVAKVPNLEMPAGEKIQGPLFRDSFSEQLKKTGVNVKSLQYVSSKKEKRVAGYKVLLLQCKGKCRFDQLLDLLTGLDENPYMVGIEQFELKFDNKDRRQIDIVMTVSSFAR